jgi:hypothetical protein
VSAAAAGQWWPSDLGSPSSTGGQNNVRYAVFPGSRRLVVDIGGHVTVYDTLDNQIGGVSQQQGGNDSMTFSSQYGTINVSSLPVISGQRLPASNPFSRTSSRRPSSSMRRRPMCRPQSRSGWRCLCQDRTPGGFVPKGHSDRAGVQLPKKWNC